ncbi:hypothetical protein GBF38_004482, partial [Nibea albiflora]
DEFACHGVVMNGRKAEEMCCGLIGSGKVKSGLATCPRFESHRGCDPPADVQVYVHISVASSSVDWSVSNRPQHRFDICFDKESNSISVSQGPSR